MRNLGAILKRLSTSGQLPSHDQVLTNEHIDSFKVAFRREMQGDGDRAVTITEQGGDDRAGTTTKQGGDSDRARGQWQSKGDDDRAGG